MQHLGVVETGPGHDEGAGVVGFAGELLYEYVDIEVSVLF